MIILFGFAFLSGIVTILAPCIWPLLPIVLSSSSLGGHKRPLGITLGVMISFAFFTVSFSYLVALFHLDPNVLRLLAVVIIFFLGIIMIVPQFLAKVEALTSRFSGQFGGVSKQSSGFGSGFLTGLSLGIVWSPCAGPILATIAALSATMRVSLQTILVTLFYSLGVGIPLFAFATGGSILFKKSKFLNTYLGRIQQGFGVIMIATAVAIYTNFDKTVETRLLNLFPSYSNFLTSFETTQPVTSALNNLKGQTNTQNLGGEESPLVGNPAPDFAGGTTWLNLPNGQSALNLQSLKGKVVLVDFWTYTCINCIRTLPFVTSWYEKYKNQGFVVIGVHTPEFQFEHDTNNVKAALKQFSITYPVVQDNTYAIWNAYSNEYWPAEYLIDSNGVIRRVHFGEGEYDQTEKAIQALLKEAGKKVATSLVTLSDQTPHTQLSPETYLGSNRMQYFYPDGTVRNGTQTFTLRSPTQDSFSLGGTWTITPETAITGDKATLAYTFYANKVFLVLRPGLAKSSVVKVFLDNKLIDAQFAGSDVHDGVITIDSDRLYNLVDLHGNAGKHVLRLEFQNSGIEAFAFTFG